MQDEECAHYSRKANDNNTHKRSILCSFDVEFPIECDDEYWEPEDPEQAFKQPSGKPCKITAFIYSLKLGQILVYTLRTLYATKKSKILSGYAGAEWERLIVSELDSSMNKWKDSLPQFCKCQ